jgi:hypothetical protein
MRLSLLMTATILIPLNVYGGEVFPLSTARSDPSQLCNQVSDNLPRQIEMLRKIGDLIHETATATDEFDCNERLGGCKRHALVFRGLELDILAAPSFDTLWIMGATVSSSNWKFLGDIRVGQSLTAFEKHFGVTIPRDVSPIKLMGECTPMTIWHREGRVAKFTLDCQACY